MAYARKARKRPSRTRLGGLPGHLKRTHEAYFLLRALSHGELDGRTSEFMAVKAIAHTLAADQPGGEWAKLSAARRLLTEVTAVEQHGVIDPATGRLKSPFDEHFLAFANGLRHNLVVLGLDRGVKDVVDLSAYVQAKYGDGDPDADAEGDKS